MDTYEPVLRTGTSFTNYFREIQEFEATTQVATAARTSEDTAFENFTKKREQDHQDNFPLGENLYALLFYCLSDLDSRQRETFATIMATQQMGVKDYTFELLRRTFQEHFCTTNSLENPNLRESGGHGMKSFCIMEDVEYEGSYGYWAEDEDTEEVGFLD